MEMRDWLIVMGVLVLIGLALDAVRRIRNRNQLQLSIDKKFQNLPEQPNDEVGPVRVVSVESAQAGPREPSFQETVVIDPEESGRREPVLTESPSAADDILLADDFQGVGEGAGDFLGEVRVRTADTAPDNACEDRGETSPIPVEDAHDPQPDPAVTDTFNSDAQAGAAESTDERAQGSAASPAWESPLPDAVTSADDKAVADAAACEQGLQPESIDPLADTQPKQSADAVDAPTDTPAASPLTVVADAEPTLDLSRPIPELLAEQTRSLNSEQPAASRGEEGVAAASERGASTDPLHATDPLLEGMSASESVTPSMAGDDQALSALTASVEPAAATDVDAAVASESKPANSKRAKREVRPEVQTDIFDNFPELAPIPESEPAAKASRKKGATRSAKAGKSQQETPAQDEVLVISVIARDAPFNGTPLFKLVEACGLTFGKMNIFHRHEQANGEGPVQFSMVNALQPGTFNLDNPAAFDTRGVTFFLTMSEPSKLKEAFDCMLATAQCVAENLDGELRDEQRSSLRPQTIEHFRHKISEFERRRLARRA